MNFRRHSTTLPGLTLASLGLATGCGGSSTHERDPLAPPPAAPNADVGQERASRDAALASEERAAVQRRTDTIEKAGRR